MLSVRVKHEEVHDWRLEELEHAMYYALTFILILYVSYRCQHV
jgi:hypothetical protein